MRRKEAKMGYFKNATGGCLKPNITLPCDVKFVTLIEQAF